MIQDSYCFQSQAEVPVVASIDEETPHTSLRQPMS